MYKYGNIIKKARTRKGYSQEKLAEKLYISKQSVSKYENNHSIPSEDIKNKLEELLDIKLLDSQELFSIQKSRLILIFSSVVTILFLGIIALSLNIIKINEAYIESNLDYQQLLLDYQELNDQVTLDYYGISITYADYYSFGRDNIYIDLVIHNSTDSQYKLNSELFTINDLTINTNNRLLEEEREWVSKGILPNETYICSLRLNIAAVNDYFIQLNHIDLFYAEQFITRINLEIST